MYLFGGAFQFAQDTFNYFGEVLNSWFGGLSVWEIAVNTFQRSVTLLEGVGGAFVSGIETVIAGLYKVGESLYGAAASVAEALGYDDLATTARALSEEAGRASSEMI